MKIGFGECINGWTIWHLEWPLTQALFKCPKCGYEAPCNAPNAEHWNADSYWSCICGTVLHRSEMIELDF